MSEVLELPVGQDPSTLFDDALRVEVSARPIFIVGSLGSGTGILHWSLGQHPNLMPLMDSGWLARFAVDLQSRYGEGVRRVATSQLGLANIEIDDFCAYFGESINHLFLQMDGSRTKPLHLGTNGDVKEAPDSSSRACHPRGPRRWLDASPDMCFSIFSLLRLFPQAKFLHIWRDADSAVAVLTDPALRRLYYPEVSRLSEQTAYEHWTKSVTACLEAEEAFGSDTVMRVHRDDLVRTPEPVLRWCLEFIGEPFADACLRPFR